MPTTFLIRRPNTQYAPIVILACLVGSPPAFAQGAVAESDADPDAVEPASVVEPGSDDVVDEIIVVAPKTVTAIKAQIVRADRRMYGLYNELNTDREYDIHCRLEKVYASNRKERICLPQFEHGVLEEAWDDMSTWTGAGRPEAELRRKREILKQKMIDFSEQDPELKKAIYERARLQRELKEAEERRRGSSQDD